MDALALIPTMSSGDASAAIQEDMAELALANGSTVSDVRMEMLAAFGDENMTAERLQGLIDGTADPTPEQEARATAVLRQKFEAFLELLDPR